MQREISFDQCPNQNCNCTGWCAKNHIPFDLRNVRTFESGAVRDSNEGKSRPDLISPYFTNRLGLRLAEGAKKYAERNWERGIPTAAFLESLERHLVAYKMGKKDEDHAGAIAFNIMGIIHNEEIKKIENELDERP